MGLHHDPRRCGAQVRARGSAARAAPLPAVPRSPLHRSSRPVGSRTGSGETLEPSPPGARNRPAGAFRERSRFFKRRKVHRRDHGDRGGYLVRIHFSALSACSAVPFHLFGNALCVNSLNQILPLCAALAASFRRMAAIPDTNGEADPGRALAQHMEARFRTTSHCCKC